MIKVSTQARNQVMQMMKSDGYDISDSFVRVGVKSGGCSGLSYELKFDKALGLIGCHDIAPKAYPPHHDHILEGLDMKNLAKK